MSLVVMLAFSLLFCSDTSLGQAERDSDEDGRPWQNPLQELQSITPSCALKIPEFYDIASREEGKWQDCIDKITLAVTEKFPVLESRSNAKEEETVNSSVIYEIDKELHMVICRNTSAYKSCWDGILHALNNCDPGRGDVSGKLYYSLYDDICRDGGRITVENRRKAALEGKLCERDYSTDECRRNRKTMNAKDLCLRFQSNTACDLSSIDPNCTNNVDKGLHAEIFERVEKELQCSLTFPAGRGDRYPSSAPSLYCNGVSEMLLYISFMLLFRH